MHFLNLPPKDESIGDDNGCLDDTILNELL